MKKKIGTKHRRTLEAIFRNPPSATVPWKDCEALLLTLGAEMSEGAGSRVRFFLHGIKAVFHRPHPRKETDKGALVSLRKFLENAGISSQEVKKV